MLAIPIKSKNNSKISTKFSQSTYFAFYKEGEIFIDKNQFVNDDIGTIEWLKNLGVKNLIIKSLNLSSYNLLKIYNIKTYYLRENDLDISETIYKYKQNSLLKLNETILSEIFTNN